MEQDPGWQYLRQSQDQKLAAQTKKFDSKKNVWIADAEDGFLEAEIKATKGDQVTVVTSKGEVRRQAQFCVEGQEGAACRRR